MSRQYICSARPFAAMALGLFVGACGNRDLVPAERPGQSDAHIALVAVTPDTSATRTFAISLAGSGSGVIVGSFRVAVMYDTTRLRFAGPPKADTLLLAVHDLGGRVLVAGASAGGFSPGEWVRLAFTPRTARDVAPPPTLEILEASDLRGTDLRAQLKPPVAK